MTINAYVRGQQVRVAVAISNAAGAASDPAGLAVKLRTPAGAISTKTYGADAEVVRDAAGAYHLDVDAAAEGDWHYRWEGSGSNRGAGEGQFRVIAGVFG